MKKGFQQKNILVVGLGKSGRAAADLLLSQGAAVTLADQRTRSELKSELSSLPKKIKLILGRHLFSTTGFDLIIVSPGVSWQHPSLIKARQNKISVWPELEMGWRQVAPFKTVAVTGTNGKTTTTAMIGHILKMSHLPVVVGGNIGTPLSALSRKISPQTFLILEVSSYQLEAHRSFHPQVAVFLNVTPDHLARHKTLANYAGAKRRLLLNMTQEDSAVYNLNDKWCRKIVSHTPAKKIAFPSSALFHLASNTSLRGKHNLENAMAAAASCRALGLSDQDIINGIKTFKGVAHRLQVVGRKKGVLYVNDSKGTNVDSTLVALKSFNEPIVLLLGGEHKGSSYKPLLPQVRQHVKEVVAFGEAKHLIKKDLQGAAPLTMVENLGQAMNRAKSIARRGDVVLLSPACASFDQYSNYEERGAHFVSLVKRLKE